MKKILILLINTLCFNWCLDAQIQQCDCDFDIRLEQNISNPCVFDVYLCSDIAGGGNCGDSQYDQLTILPDTINYKGAIGNAWSFLPNMKLVGWDEYVIGFEYGEPFNNIVSGCDQETLIGSFEMEDISNEPLSFMFFMGGSQTGTFCSQNNSGNFDIDCELPPTKFAKIYGDSSDNRPTVIKSFGDGIYLASSRLSGNQEYSTFTKFNLNSGDIIWQKKLDTLVRINDFEYIPEEDAFLLVGHSTPYLASVNNESFILKMDDFGNVLNSKFYFRNGRETFNRIIRHNFPRDPNFRYYVLGTQNPTATTTHEDQITLFNFDNNLKVKWIQEYIWRITINGDDEFHRGIAEIPQGDLLIMGNDILDNDGILVVIDGSTGNVSTATRTNTGRIDYYDGIFIDDKNTFLVGEYFENNEALITNGNTGFTFPDIDRFKDIWTDGKGKIFTIGRNKNPTYGGDYPVLFRFSYKNNGELSFDEAHYLLESTEEDFEEGVICVTPEHNRVFYADARKYPSGSSLGFGNFDILTGTFDFNLGEVCSIQFDPFKAPISYVTEVIQVQSKSVQEPFNYPKVNSLDTDYQCKDFCLPICDLERESLVPNIICSRTWAMGVVPSGFTGTPIYTWNFDDGTIIQGGTRETHTYAANGTYRICITADDGNCSATHCSNVTIDAQDPFISPPSTTTFDVSDIQNCTNDIDLTVISRDPCAPLGSLPRISCTRSDGSNSLSDPWPLGTTSVTCTATGLGGLTSETTFDVVVNDPTGDCDCKAPEFYKLYGDNNRNSISKLDYHQGAIYALGLNGSSDADYQSYFMKLDMNGEILWTAQLPSGIVMNDFIPSKTGFLLVGDTRPIGTNTNSVVVKINTDGTMDWAKNYNFSGRERFIRIAPASLPGNTSIASNTEFLILGFVTPSGSIDDQNIVKIHEDGTHIWRKRIGL